MQMSVIFRSLDSSMSSVDGDKAPFNSPQKTGD
jgi:hypothetical protein